MTELERFDAYCMQEQWGALFDIWVTMFGTGQELFDRMLEHDYSRLIEIRYYKVVGHTSVYDLLYDLFEEKKHLFEDFPVYNQFSHEYWLGEYLVYYMCSYKRTFAEICSIFTFDQLIRMFYPYHEVGVYKYATDMEEIARSKGLRPLEYSE